MPSIGTRAGSTHKRQEGFLEFAPCTFPSTVCLALGCNTTVSLLMIVHASESFITTSCGCRLISLVFGGVSSPKFLKLLFLVDLMHPGSTLPSREGFWGIETWVIRPRPSLRLHSSKRASCCDDANKSKFECRHNLKESLPKSNLACRGVKNSIQLCHPRMLAICKPKMNDWRWLYPFEIRLAIPNDIQAVSRYSERFKCSTFE